MFPGIKVPDIEVPLTEHYGQRGEDLIVQSIIDALVFQKGFNYSNVTYLEIGANHPISTSSTYLLYQRGANGVLVEANPKLIPALKRVRSRDTIINAAIVGMGAGKVSLFVSTADELSTLVRKNLDYWPDYPLKKTFSVDSLEISKLLQDFFSPKELNFLSIDVEGPDFEILERIDLARFPFDIIQIEPSNHIHKYSTERIANYLHLKGYSLVATTEVNCLFLKSAARTGDHVVQAMPFPSHQLSFDVFDTLITRRFGEPESVLKAFCHKHGIDFESRVRADNGQRNLQEIYEAAGIPLQLMHDEVLAELENLIPIRENIELVRPGDALVSDMYLSKEQMLALLDKFNLSRNSLYVSNSDKASGKYWAELNSKALPLLHFGDNELSDYRNAMEVGVGAVLTKNAKLTQYERNVKIHNESLAWLLREVRLGSIQSTSDIVDRVSLTYNLGLIFAFCELLHETGRNLVFLGRDCFLLSKIYRAFFGQCEYMQFSRDLLQNLDLAAKKLRSTGLDEPLFVDLVSSGATWTALADEFEVMVLIRIVDWAWGPADPNLKRLSCIFTNDEVQHSIVLELLNPGPLGRLLSIDPKTLDPLAFADHEIPADRRERLLEVAEKTVALSGFYPHLAGKIKNPRELARHSLQEIWNLDQCLRNEFAKSIEIEDLHLDKLKALRAD
jgi:FkbM family methyltransferase